MKRSLNIIDRIGRIIPGYKGYAVRDSRRHIDKDLRVQIASKLSLTEKKIEQHCLALVRNNQNQVAMEWEYVRKAINTLIPKIKNASYGVSGFFSDDQIKESELDKIYDLDLKLSERINLINTSIVENINEAIMSNTLMQSLSAIDELLNDRIVFINQFK